jgi:hypothetical protein
VFISPDKYVQQPDNSQNYNRYSYCINNPLRYTDPTGYSFLFGWIPEIIDFVKTVFTGGLDPTSSKARDRAWKRFDPTASWSITNKDMKIDMGLFKTDPHRTLLGKAEELYSRFTWELPQTLLGNGFSQVRNMLGHVDDVSYYGGATLINRNEGPDKRGLIWEWGMTLGPYINSINMKADPNTDMMFRHEYGHTLQSQLLGPLYITKVGLPSLIGSILDGWGMNDHRYEWYEVQADRLSYRYFKKYDSDALNSLIWDYNGYPTKDRPTIYGILALFF